MARLGSRNELISAQWWRSSTGRAWRFGALLLVLCSGTLNGAASSSSVRAIWQIGYIPQNAAVDHVFYLPNTSDKPLTVTGIQTSCSCTTAGSADSTIAPGDSLALIVTFDSKRLLHSVRKTVTVTTDDSTSSPALFQLEAYVLPEGEPTGIYRVTPTIISWASSDTIGHATGDSIAVKNLGGDPVPLRVETCCGDCVTAMIVPTVLGGGVTEWIHLRGQRGAHGDACTNGSVTLHFGDTEKTIITVPIQTAHGKN